LKAAEASQFHPTFVLVIIWLALIAVVAAAVAAAAAHGVAAAAAAAAVGLSLMHPSSYFPLFFLPPFLSSIAFLSLSSLSCPLFILISTQ